MAPKKDVKKQEDPIEAKYLAEISALEQAKSDMQVQQSFLVDKFRQMKAENERIKGEVDGVKGRLVSATDDYSDILRHRQEQIESEESKLKRLQAQVERLEVDIARKVEELSGLKAVNAAQARKLDDASQMLADKENLEEAVRRQHDLIERQSEELKVLRKQLTEKELGLDGARSQIEELTLKSGASTELKILFEEPWLLQLSYARLKGDLPVDREWGTLSPLSGGKQLLLFGGSSKSAGPAGESAGREVALLSLESMRWDRPTSVRMALACQGHTTSVVGRTKILVFGGARGEAASAELSTLNTDTMKWVQLQLKGGEKPAPRAGHAACCIREKMFVFGGATAEGGLLNDLWIFDQDSSQWTRVTCFGSTPAPRRGATINATEDGRRLFVFGGNDGTRNLNDVSFLDLEKLMWNAVPVHVGVAPEPREDHVSSIVAKYLIVSGGCGGHSGVRKLCDTHVMDLYQPRWECLDGAPWSANMVWLKHHAAYSAFLGNKLITLKPNMHDRLWEVQLLEWQLPEDIERLRNEKRRDLRFADKLELMADAVCGANTLELSWRPPTKNAERIEKYKLMIATGTGVVRDVYLGIETRFRITGLRSNTEFVLCVKALYDDGSFLWSESKAFKTLL
ncbi:MAG: hypothetical protein WDW38_010526 [Sanguina aurantia]